MKDKEITDEKIDSEKNSTYVSALTNHQVNITRKNTSIIDQFIEAESVNSVDIVDRKFLIKKCHRCGSIIESYTEVKQCPSCKKHFLPINYFSKVSKISKVSKVSKVSEITNDSKLSSQSDYSKMFSSTDELSDDDLIKGLYVLW
ncbi:MAG: hypothetical protein HQK49_12795 [Oligoflexia bacterium]|nr:hypothetical protein [Oligoflexia bacterium]